MGKLKLIHVVVRYDVLKTRSMLMKKSLLSTLLVLGAVSLSGCSTVATIAGADTASLNAKAEQYYQQLTTEARAAKKLDTTSATYKRINAVFNRMIPYADQMNKTGHKFDWKLAVIKSDEVNAHVAPGGKVVFYTGIVEKLKLTNDEIAAIMGHEMVHALEEHSKTKAGAEVLTGLAVNIGSAYAGLGSTGQQLAGLGAELGLGLPYSRNLESRADEGGLMLMARAGYNPNAAITLWQKMQANDGAGGPAFLSTHPSNKARIEAMKKNLPAALAVYQQR